MKKDELTYAQAISRLEEIVKMLEAGEVTVDELSASVKEGVRLVAWCRRKLKTAQTDVEAALRELDQPQATTERSARRAPQAVSQPTLGIADDPDDPFATE